MLRTRKNRLVSVVAVRPPVLRAVKPACRGCGIAMDDSPERGDVKYFQGKGLPSCFPWDTMIPMRYEITSTDLFDAWVSRLDRTLKNRLLSRIGRAEQGNFGDCKEIVENLFELRAFFGGGLRVYFTIRENAVILLLAGGDKDSQTKDIKTAKEIMATLKPEE
jgi:putative addiction module killer protein